MEKKKQELNSRLKVIEIDNEIINNQKDFLKKYQDLCKRALRGWSRTLYEWKISFIIGLLMNIMWLIIGILIGIQIS